MPRLNSCLLSDLVIAVFVTLLAWSLTPLSPPTAAWLKTGKSGLPQTNPRPTSIGEEKKEEPPVHNLGRDGSTAKSGGGHGKGHPSKANLDRNNGRAGRDLPQSESKLKPGDAVLTKEQNLYEAGESRRLNLYAEPATSEAQLNPLRFPTIGISPSTSTFRHDAKSETSDQQRKDVISTFEDQNFVRYLAREFALMFGEEITVELEPEPTVILIRIAGGKGAGKKFALEFGDPVSPENISYWEDLYRSFRRTHGVRPLAQVIDEMAFPFHLDKLIYPVGNRSYLPVENGRFVWQR